MKKHLVIAVLASISLLFSQCKSNKGTSGTTDSLGNSVSSDEPIAVCVWDRTPVKDTPDEKGKWIASLNLGEKCTYLDDSKEVTTGNKTTTFHKIKLQDGKEGWAQSDLVILNSRPATFIQNAEIYSRPDLLTKTANSFTKMDIVAVKSTQNGFVEVTGKRTGGKWIESGWIKESNLSYTDVDIAVAKFASKALAITDEVKKMEAINSIISNTDFSKSVFIDELTEMATSSQKVTEEPVADTLVP